MEYESQIRDPVALEQSYWDWAILSGCFGDNPTTIPMDVDGLIERNGRFLVFETKGPRGELSLGQRIALETLARLKQFTVVILHGPRNQPGLVEVWYRGQFGRLVKTKPQACNVEWLRDFSKRWWTMANSKGG